MNRHSTSGPSAAPNEWRRSQRPADDSSSRPQTKYLPPGARSTDEDSSGRTQSRYVPPAARGTDEEPARPQGQSRYIPPAVRGAEGPSSNTYRAAGGWRDRERLKEESNSRPGTPGRQSPAPPEDDGFQPVSKPKVYRPPGARAR
ncbi:hypothetical protein FRC17_003892, partial [Serendipita sp. 399]